MRRPLFYIAVIVVFIFFWGSELLGNYADYSEGSPIFLKDSFARLFEANRLALIGTELLIPLFMTVVFVVLLIMKMRPMSVRYPLLLMQFLGTQFWLIRAFFFKDRLVRYYQMSDPEFYMRLPSTDPFLWYFIANLLLLLLVAFVREYSQEEEDDIPEVDRPARIE